MKPKLVVIGSGAKLSMVSFDLADPEEALAMARRMAEQTGRTVTVRDANGEVVGTIQAQPKN